MKHITIKYDSGFFDFNFNNVSTNVTKRRKIIGHVWDLEIYADNKFVKAIECESEEYANKLAKILKEDIEDSLSVSFLI